MWERERGGERGQGGDVRKGEEEERGGREVMWERGRREGAGR